MICNSFPEPSYFLFSSDVPQLLYYSHIPTILVSILLGIFILLNNRRDLTNRLLFGVTFSFALLVFFNLILWTNTHSDLMITVWTVFTPVLLSIVLFSLYLSYVFVEKKDIPFYAKILLLFSLLPAIIFLPTNFNVRGFNITNCGSYGFEGEAYLTYIKVFCALAIFISLIILVRGVVRSVGERKKEIALFGVGLIGFLMLFFFTYFVAQYLVDNNLAPDSGFEMYGLFGMDIFAIFLAYLIVKFKAFNAKLLGAQALIAALIILIGSEFFFVESTVNRVLVTITFVATIIAGYFLIRSVKKEVKQREQLEELTTKLEVANEHLKALDKMKSEFVSIASHQLRSPITAIRGYISMLMEGSYGKFPEKAQEVLDRVAESSKFMASSIEDYLNVSRIEAGNMKYELSDFSLKEQAEKVADELRQVALKKGLVLVFRSDITGSAFVHADIGKTRQVIMNFIDNAIKYTPKGTVTVVVHDDPKKKKVAVTIHDSGIGMSKETLAEVFDKFVRAKNANQINVTGTGLGLYVAKKMAHGMGGKVWADSEGEGKGSSFHLEFPELPGSTRPV